MRRNGFTPVLMVFVIAILGVLGYLFYKNNFFFNNSSPSSSIPASSIPVDNTKAQNKVYQNEDLGKNLVGIWQSNGSMAAGWSDRYHFYSNGTYHFYPSQMSCNSMSEEQKGNWKLQDEEITITVISTKKGCDETKKLTQLAQPYDKIRNILDLGTQPDDIYPSFLLEGAQYWKFSDDPTSYGTEKFSSE